MAGKTNLRMLGGIVWILVLAGMALRPGRIAYATAYTVNSTADTDDGYCNLANCTLREAIRAAMVGTADDTITFRVDGTITLGSSLPPIRPTGGALTIDGAGQSITIHGNEAVRPLDVLSGAHLTLLNLTVTRGYASFLDGGGVWNGGTLTMDHCTFSYNRAGDRGGAIANLGMLTVTNSTFSNNNVDYISGGAIWNEAGATAIIAGSSFLGNQAEFGGAIYNTGSLTISESNLGLNSSGNAGGAIASESSESVRIQECSLGFNTSTFKGGAIYTFEGTQGFYIRNSTLEYNSSYQGGAIYASGGTGAVVQLTHSTLNQNVADYGAGAYLDGGYLVSIASEFTHNQADFDGGGVYSNLGRLSVQGTTLASNSADRNGGGVYISIDSNGPNITGSTLYENYAGGDGGGVWNDNDFHLSITNSTFAANRAYDQGGGIYNAGFGDLLNCTFSGNQAASGGGVYGGVSIHVQNTIVADSLAGGNCGYLSTPPGNDGNNIDSGTTCGWGSTSGSMSNTNPHLDILRWNGGPTQTMALLAGSLARDGVDWNAPNDCPETDQRGLPRPFGDYCEIGAFETVFYNFMPLARKH